MKRHRFTDGQTRTVVVFRSGGITNEVAHELVRTGAADEARVETAGGTILFRAWRIPGSANYAWRTATMPAPAFWPVA